VESVLKLWFTASIAVMPASQYSSAHAIDRPRYRVHRVRAVCAMRGVSFSFLIGPGVSAMYNCMPPTRSMGSSATADTITPMPPNHCSSWRKNSNDGARRSRSVITVAPVVVNADEDSNSASANPSPPPSMNGMDPNRLIAVHSSATTRKP